MSWEDSRANCLGYGADLVSILTSSESDFIDQQIRTNQKIRTLTNYIKGSGLDYSVIKRLVIKRKSGPGVMAIISQILSSGQWVNQVIAIMMKTVLAFIPIIMGGMHDYDCAKLFSSICKNGKGTQICVGFLYRIPKF